MRTECAGGGRDGPRSGGDRPRAGRRPGAAGNTVEPVAVRESRRDRLSTDRLRGRAVVRDPAEEARAASSLELLFDLTFVVAVNQASAGLVHELLAGRVADGVIGFAMVFFAVWWAWMNFTWFSSAHDADDLPHRLLTLALPPSLDVPSFVVLAAGELAVPVWAERAKPRPLFNAGHIEERYNLFTLIVLGESILAATVGFQEALTATGLTAGLLAVGVGGLVLAFSAWWLYFDHPGHLTPTTEVAFRWGYAHVVVFAALAAMGAGIHVAADTGAAGGDGRVAALAVAVPVAGFLTGLALVMLLTGTPLRSPRIAPKLAGAALVLATGLVAPPAAAVVGAALVMAGLGVAMVLVTPG